MTPTPHYRQHHDVEPPRVDETTFRASWRVRTRLDRLLLDGAITPREWFAAASYRHAWETAIGMALKPSPLAAGGLNPISGDNHAVRRLDALAALRMDLRRIGPFACRLIEACVVDDMSWRDLGRAFGIDPRTARGWVVAAIKLLVVAKKRT